MRRDQHHYTRDQIEALLPLVYDEDSLVLASRAESEIRSRTDPAHGGGLLAAVIDVRRAWHHALEREDHDFLVARHVHKVSYEAIAELAGLEDANEAADIETCAIDSMLRFLNGER